MNQFTVHNDCVYFNHENGSQYLIGKVSSLSSITEKFSQKLSSGELDVKQIPVAFSKRESANNSLGVFYFG